LGKKIVKNIINSLKGLKPAEKKEPLENCGNYLKTIIQFIYTNALIVTK